MSKLLSASLLWTVLIALSCPTAMAEAPALVHNTAIGGARTGYTTVTLTQTIRPLDDGRPTIGLEGGGRVLGLVLRREKDGPFEQPPSFEVLRLSPSNDGEVLLSLGNGKGASGSELPPGQYRLYLITDEPGKVTLSFPTIPTGSASLAPAIITPFRAESLTARRARSDLNTFGAFGNVSEGGIELWRLVAANPPLTGQIELCMYMGQNAQNSPDAFDPGCPGGKSTYQHPVNQPGDGAFEAGFIEGPSAEGLGGNLSTLIGDTGAVDAFAMWMSYDFPPPVYTPPPATRGPDDPNLGPQCPSRSCSWGGTTGGSGGAPTSNSRGSRYGVARLTNRGLRVRRGRALVPLACSGAGPCRGTVALSPGGRARFALSKRQRSTVRVLLSRSALRQLRRGPLRTRVTVTSRLAGGAWENRAVARLAR
jgi:hypothetical protein